MFTTVIIFIIILFLYIHIQKEYKYYTDLQIYETDYFNKKQLLEELTTRLPMVTNITLPTVNHEFLLKYTNHDFCVKELNELYHTKEIKNIPLNFSRVDVLVETDKKSSYYSSNNNHIFDSGIFDKYTQEWDSILKPNASISKYDLINGSKHSVTPFFCHKSSSMFLFLPPRCKEVKVRLMPYNMRNDFESYEYASVEEWVGIPPKKITNDKNSLELFLYHGQVLYIPPFWFYSIEFLNSKTVVNVAQYSSYINVLSNMKYHLNSITQQHQSIDIKDFYRWITKSNSSSDVQEDINNNEQIQSDSTDVMLDISNNIVNKSTKSEKLLATLKMIE